jgi:parallel beta-helix repeat protein
MNGLSKSIIAVVGIATAFYIGFTYKGEINSRGIVQTTSSNPLFNAGGSTGALSVLKSASGAIFDVREGQSIQQAVKQAKAGDVINVYPGTYHETVYIDKDGITLSGIVVNSEWPTLDGEGKLNDAVLYSGNNTVVENLRIINYKGNGIFGQAGNNFVIRNNLVHKTGVYGIFPQFGTNGLISGNILSGIADAAIYVGMSDNIDVIHNEVYDSVAGIEIENSRHALVEGNYTHNNTGGILVFITPGLPVKTTYDVIIRRNFVINNNHANFGAPGSIVAGVPSGLGIMVMAGDDVIIEDNIISGNKSVGILVTDLNFQSASKDPDSEPNTDRLMVLNNVMSNNGYDPIAEIIALKASKFLTGGLDFLDTNSALGKDKCILNGSRYIAYGLESYFQCDYEKMNTLAIQTMTLAEPAAPYVLAGTSKDEFEHSLGMRTYYGICSGCHLTKGVLIGPSIEDIQSIYFSTDESTSEIEEAETLEEGIEALSNYIYKPIKVREEYPEMPPQDYLSKETRQAVAKYLLTMDVEPAS